MEQVEQLYRNNCSIYNIMFYTVYHGPIGKRHFGPRRHCVSYMETAPLAPPLYFGIQTMPRSCKRSSTLRSESGKRRYNITAKRMISGLVLKDLIGECFIIQRGYKTALLASTEFNLTVPLAFTVLNYHRFMGFYYTPFRMALLGMRGLVHGPRPKLNYPAPTVHR